MNNICKLIILMILPSLSFAADQAPSIDLSRYSLTAKVLTTYFKTTPTTIKNTFQNCRFTKPDGAQITVYEVRPEDSVVNFNVEASVCINKFAPGIRESLITTALVQTLEKKIKENESWSSWFSRKAIDLPNNIFTEYWLDDGIAGRYNIEPPFKIICRGSISRELFDAINKMSHNSNLAVPTNESESKHSLVPNNDNAQSLSKIIATSSTAENNNSIQQFREQKLKQTTPAQKKVCSSFIEQLVRSGAYTTNQELDQTNINFQFKFSDNMRGFTKDILENDTKKYGADKIPDYISDNCKGDVECLATWFFWWSFYNKSGASAQYVLENGSELVLDSTHTTNDFSGYVSMPTALFEAIKQQANNASE